MLASHGRRHGRSALALGVLLAFLANASGLFNLDVDIDTASTPLDAVVGSREFLVLLVLGLLLAAALPRLRPIQSSLLTLFAMLPILWMGYANPGSRPLVPMEYSLLTILVLFSVNVLGAYLVETRQRQRLLDAFGQFVPPEVVARISRADGEFSLEAESRELSLMFCDVRNFSGLSETLSPKQLSELLNTLFTPLTEIIYRQKGVVDKYLGDGIMAFWGAPLDDAQHAGNALLAAFEIQDALNHLRDDFEARGWPSIQMGIGINTGTVSVGNMGSRYRVAYTAVGDAVNLAARLQDLTRVFATRIIVGESTQRAFPGATYRELGLVQVRGKQTLVRIYEPCNPATDLQSTVIANMQRHNEALRHYYARRWDVAEPLFEKLKQANPVDPLYDYYLARIEDFRLQPPPADWNGELRFTVK